MRLLLRALVLLLAFATTGIVAPLANLGERCQQGHAETQGAADHSHESDGCEGCSPNCAVCVCCPLRAANTAPVAVVATALRTESLRPDETAFLPAGIDAVIFHPPRA